MRRQYIYVCVCVCVCVCIPHKCLPFFISKFPFSNKKNNKELCTLRLIHILNWNFPAVIITLLVHQFKLDDQLTLVVPEKLLDSLLLCFCSAQATNPLIFFFVVILLRVFHYNDYQGFPKGHNVILFFLL